MTETALTRTNLPSIRTSSSSSVMSSTHVPPGIGLFIVDSFESTEPDPLYMGGNYYQSRVGFDNTRFITIGRAEFPGASDTRPVGAKLFSITTGGDLELLDSIELITFPGLSFNQVEYDVDRLGINGTDWVVQTNAYSVGGGGNFYVRRISVAEDSLVVGPLATLDNPDTNAMNASVAGSASDTDIASVGVVWDTSIPSEHGQRIRWYTVNLDTGTFIFQTDISRATIGLPGDSLFGIDMARVGNHIFAWVLGTGLTAGGVKFLRLTPTGSILESTTVDTWSSTTGIVFIGNPVREITPNLVNVSIQRNNIAGQVYEAWVTPSVFGVVYGGAIPTVFNFNVAFNENHFTRYDIEVDPEAELGLSIRLDFHSVDNPSTTIDSIFVPPDPQGGLLFNLNQVSDTVFTAFDQGSPDGSGTWHIYTLVRGGREKTIASPLGVAFHRLN